MAETGEGMQCSEVICCFVHVTHNIIQNTYTPHYRLPPVTGTSMSAMDNVFTMQIEMLCHLIVVLLLLVHIWTNNHGRQRLLHGLSI